MVLTRTRGTNMRRHRTNFKRRPKLFVPEINSPPTPGMDSLVETKVLAENKDCYFGHGPRGGDKRHEYVCQNPRARG